MELIHQCYFRKRLLQVVQRLKKCARDSQAAFEVSVRSRGLEHTCHRTVYEFSTADHAHWCRQLHSAYKADLTKKMASLEGLRYNSSLLASVLSAWEKIPPEVQGNGFTGHEPKCMLYCEPIDGMITLATSIAATAE